MRFPTGLLTVLLLLFLAGDLVWTFRQHLDKPLDGDLPRCVVPAEDVVPVLQDPFGLRVWTDTLRYQNPNRYFVHRIMYDYFRLVPGRLQGLFDPIESVYVSTALAKWLIQVALLFLLALIVSQVIGGRGPERLLAAAIAAPFFQTNGYRSYMGIIDPATTYTFQYALPALFLLLGVCGLLRARHLARPPWQRFLFLAWWILLGLVTCFSGPLNPAVVLLAGGVICLFGIKEHFIPGPDGHDGNGQNEASFRGMAIAMALTWLPMALYSLWLGTFGVEQVGTDFTFGERYALLLTGLGKLLTGKLGLPLLLAALAGLYVLLGRRPDDPVARRMRTLCHGFALFALLWLLLLPWGGYRVWRPYFIRYDTLLPVTLGMIMLYGGSVICLARTLRGPWRGGLIALAVAMGLIFTLADGGDRDGNACERQALATLSRAEVSPVLLQAECTVLSWKPVTDPGESDLAARLLVLWGITPEPRLYYQTAPSQEEK